MIGFLYMLIILGIPIFYCILLGNLRDKLPDGHIVISVLMGFLIVRTIIALPMYMIVPVISESSYELFKTCLLLLIEFYIYGIIIACLYIASYICMKKEKKFIISRIIITVISIVLICFLGGILFKERERPDDQYMKMKEIYANDSLIGLSKEEVVNKLGKPMKTYYYKNTDEESYTYNAGAIHIGIIWGKCNIFTTRHGYHFTVYFDKEEKAKSTHMREDT